VFWVPAQTFARAEWPIRNLSFSFDGQLLAAASEDQAINIVSPRCPCTLAYSPSLPISIAPRPPLFATPELKCISVRVGGLGMKAKSQRTKA